MDEGLQCHTAILELSNVCTNGCLAHYIKNPKALRTKALCSLTSTSRWAVTGTPIQNHVKDLSSLISFIGVYPFHDPEIFDTHIINPWKTGSDLSAFDKLRLLVKNLALRRTKGSLDLPTREDSVRKLLFSEAESTRYHQLRMSLNNRATCDDEQRENDSYVNVLRWIDSLRIACSYGSGIAPDESDQASSIDTTFTTKNCIALETARFDAADFMFDVDLDLDMDDLLPPFESMTNSSLEGPVANSFQDLLSSSPNVEMPTPSWDSSSISQSRPDSRSASDLLTPNGQESTSYLFTKTQAVVDDILSSDVDDKM